MSIVYGSLAGLLIGLVTRTVMRARAGEPLISSKSKVVKTKKEAPVPVDEKVEVSCPSCSQKLRVPSTYSGVAKCPACAQTFPVESVGKEEVLPEDDIEDVFEEEAEDEKSVEEDVESESVEQEASSSSDNDVILCPDCEQKLKVPYDRRPVKARCPACKCQFRALKE
jgi:ribosomal protein S27E